MSRDTRSAFLAAAFGLALLSAALAAPGCAHVGPVVTCLGENVPPADVVRIKEDLASKNYVDLAQEAILVGWPTAQCVIDALTAKYPALAPAAREFKAAHRSEMSSNAPPPAARQVSTEAILGGGAALANPGETSPRTGDMSKLADEVFGRPISRTGPILPDGYVHGIADVSPGEDEIVVPKSGRWIIGGGMADVEVVLAKDVWAEPLVGLGAAERTCGNQMRPLPPFADGAVCVNREITNDDAWRSIRAAVLSVNIPRTAI